jgi:glycogen debranching enzyme
MNSTANGRPVVPRTGYVVEINALWYNALKFFEEMAVLMNNAEVQSSLVRLIALSGKAFTEVFLNEHGYLYDYVDGDYVDWSVRPNMIFAVALDHSPLDSKQKKKVLDTVTKELLTPRGLRSLSPKSVGYNPNYVGPQIQRDYAYHQGTAWPWLGGFYYEAYLKIYKLSGISFVERHMVGFEDEIVQHCVGSIPEVFDGNTPFKGRGAVAFAMNVAQILRTSQLLKEYESKLEG